MGGDYALGMRPHGLAAIDLGAPWLSGACLVLVLGVLGFTFLGYPLVIAVLARVLGRATPGDVPPDPAADSDPMSGAAESPRIAVVIAGYNEAARWPGRLRDLLDNGYPVDRITLMVVSDGSTDGSADVVRRLGIPGVQVLERPARRGKAACLNDGLRAVGELTPRPELVVFTDCRQRFEPGTLASLVRRFQDPRVGAVSGRLVIASAASAVGGGVDLYWRLETLIRRSEARLDSCIGCTGAIYAIRRAAYRPLPEDTILDDVLVPMQVALQGYRVLFAPDAVAVDPQASEPAREKVRKRRTLAGNFQLLFRYPGWLLPWRNRLVLQLIAHKYLRLVAPLFLALALATNLWFALAAGWWGALVLAGHLLFYLLAGLGMLLPRVRLRLLSLPAGFVFLNLMTCMGFVDYLRGRATAAWQTTR